MPKGAGEQVDAQVVKFSQSHPRTLEPRVPAPSGWTPRLKNLAVPMSGVRIGGEAKLLDAGVSVHRRRAILRVPLCAGVLIRDDVGGPVVGIVCRAGERSFGHVSRFAPRGVDDGVIGRMVLGHVRLSLEDVRYTESYNNGRFIARCHTTVSKSSC